MNNSTEKTCTELHLPYAIVFGSIMSVGVPLNATAIWIFLRHHSLKSPSVIFMLNLAVSDLLLAISLPLKVFFYATGTWPGGCATYIWVKAFFKSNVHSSAIFITLMSVDRLLAVVYPLRSRHIRTARNATKAALLAWLFLIIIDIPVSVGFKECKHRNGSFCFERQVSLGTMDKSNSPTGFLQLVLLLVLLIVNVVSAILVSLTLHRNVKDLPKVNNNVNAMLIFVMSLVMFTVCFLPMTLNFLIEGKQTYLKCLAAANCCLDPVLYYFSLDAFWKKKEERNQLQLHDVV